VTRAAASDEIADRPFVVSDLARCSPHVRSTINVRGVFRRTLIATLPCVLAALYNTGYQVNVASTGAEAGGWRASLMQAAGFGSAPGSLVDCLALGLLYVVPLLVAVCAAGGAAEWCFARGRRRHPDHSALALISVLFVLCLPAGIALWQAAVGTIVAIVIGKEIFGGIGRNVVHPVVIGLAFLYFAYPGSVSGDLVWVPGSATPAPLTLATRSGLEGLTTAGWTWGALALGRAPAALGHSSGLAAALGACVLVAAGVASWRIMAGGVSGLLLGVVGLQQLGVEQPIATLGWHWHLVTGGFAFGLVFLATDPVTSTTSNAGRWIYGLLVGLSVAVIRIANPAHEDGVVLALLLANVTAPLIDWAVARAQYRIASAGGRAHG